MAKKIETEAAPVDDVDNVEQKDPEEEFNRRVNAAVSSHASRIRNTLQKDFEALFKPMQEAVSKLQASLSAPPDKAEKKEPGLDIESAKLQDRIREMEDRWKQAEAARAEEQARHARLEERSTLVEALRKQGVDDTRIKPAVAVLISEEQRITRDEEGRIVMKVHNPKYGEELLPIEKGVSAWLSGDDGKLFLPPRGANGSGKTHGNKPVIDSKDPKAAKKAAALAVLTAMATGRSED